MTRGLQTPRLSLAPVAPVDEDRLCALLRRPEVRRFLWDDALVSRDVVRRMIAESCDPSSGIDYWCLIAATDELAGLVGLRPPVAASLAFRAIGWRSREVTIALDPRHWGQSLAREGILAMAEHAGRDGVTFALVASVDEPNARAHRLMQSCGFHALGCVPGPSHPLILYERTV